MGSVLEICLVLKAVVSKSSFGSEYPWKYSPKNEQLNSHLAWTEMVGGLLMFALYCYSCLTTGFKANRAS